MAEDLMANPNYASLLAQIATETNPTAKQALIDQCYIFTEPLTDSEIELFNYMNSGYIEDNPGIVGNSFASYVGIYFSDTGELSGD
jgi:hypothetical protein